MMVVIMMMMTMAMTMMVVIMTMMMVIMMMITGLGPWSWYANKVRLPISPIHH